MSPSTLIRWSGLSALLGGISFALFMLTHPWGDIAGPQVALGGGWVLAHSLRIAGMLLALFGLVGLYARQMEAAGRMGLIGFILAFIGTFMFGGVGIFVAYIWPVVAANAPAFTEADGPFFSRPPLILVLMDGSLTLGYILFGWASIRAAILSCWSAWLLIVGVLLFSAPTPPFAPTPWIVHVVGGVLFGGGLAGLGYTLWATYS